MTREAQAAMSCSWVTRQMVIPDLAIETLEEREHLEAGARVEVARGLVGEEERRIGDEGAGDGHALLLSARELVRRVVTAVAELHRPERGDGAVAPLLGGDSAVDERQLHVLLRGGTRQEVEPLEDEADEAVAHQRAPVVGAAADVETGEPVEAVGRAVEAAEDVHHRRLARAAGADDGHELAAAHGELHVAERAHHTGAGVVILGDVGQLDERLGLGELGHPRGNRRLPFVGRGGVVRGGGGERFHQNIDFFLSSFSSVTTLVPSGSAPGMISVLRPSVIPMAMTRSSAFSSPGFSLVIT